MLIKKLNIYDRIYNIMLTQNFIDLNINQHKIQFYLRLISKILLKRFTFLFSLYDRQPEIIFILVLSANESSSLSRVTSLASRRSRLDRCSRGRNTQVNRTSLGIPSSSDGEEFPARFPQECGSSLTKTRSFSRLTSYLLLLTSPLWGFAYQEKSHR